MLAPPRLDSKQPCSNDSFGVKVTSGGCPMPAFKSAKAYRKCARHVTLSNRHSHDSEAPARGCVDRWQHLPQSVSLSIFGYFVSY